MASDVTREQIERLERRVATERQAREDAEASLARITHDLSEAVEQAQAANDAKSMFLANMSHELRTPMTAILGYAEVLRDEPLTDDALEALLTIRRNGRHLLQVINDILDLSRIEAGELAIDCQQVSPFDILADVESLMRVAAETKRLALSLRFTTKIPSRLEADPMRVRQILVNLVGNAIKFTGAGSVEITGRMDIANHMLAIEVADTGVGIAAEQLEHIFQPFRQADSSVTRKFGGTGLGLAVSRELARAQGGDVTVVSVEGEGSRFTLTLPTPELDELELMDPEEATSVSADPEPLKDFEHHDLTGFRILLAEDGLDNQRLISMLLRKTGATVDIAENGLIAHDEVLAAESADRAYDVVLMDMQMPELDGYEATRALRGAGYDGIVIALTAHAMTGDRERCMIAGCDDYASKPVDRLVLIETIARQLRVRLA